jgi:hypothetical protein
MAIVSPPKPGQIYWTAYTPVEGDTSPVDALRLEMYAERLGNVLFPGITNRVERARYFGMVCAGLQSAEAEIGSRVHGREHTRLVRQRFVKFESAWAFAQVAHRGRDIKEIPEGGSRPRLRYEYRGFRGANRALGYWVKTEDRDSIDGRSTYKLLQAQEAQGGLGAYLVSLREHGFVHPDRLTVTAAGAGLAAAFYDKSQRKTRDVLNTDGTRSRSAWQYAGHSFALPSPHTAERRLIGEALFTTDRTLGRFVASLPAKLKDAARTKEAFSYIAAARSEESHMAQYTLAFDDLRRTCLTLFSVVGSELRNHDAPKRPVDLLSTDELATLNDEVQKSAARSAGLQAPQGLEPVAALAAELAACSGNQVMGRLVDFHRREGRRWVEPAGGDRLQLGAPGAFQDPGDGFHGYTLNAALSVYADATETAA